ncbi:MAG: hypothetical protein GY702_20890 [Desulfobulbaceae bacterium]|nr:hypothetical protein [Desulfobulbaceae bacterium]
MIWIYAVCWLGMIILAILNGVIREKVYGQLMRELSAHQLSTFVVLICFGVYIWVISCVIRIESSRQALLIGGMWLIMTVVFEFIFGHYVMHQPWERLFNDYNLLKGRVWTLVLLWTAVAPYIFYRMRAR